MKKQWTQWNEAAEPFNKHAAIPRVDAERQDTTPSKATMKVDGWELKKTVEMGRNIARKVHTRKKVFHENLPICH